MKVQVLSLDEVLRNSRLSKRFKAMDRIDGMSELKHEDMSGMDVAFAADEAAQETQSGLQAHDEAADRNFMTDNADIWMREDALGDGKPNYERNTDGQGPLPEPCNLGISDLGLSSQHSAPI